MKQRKNWWLWLGLASMGVLLLLSIAPGLLAPYGLEERLWPAWDDAGRMLPRPLPPGALGLLLGSDTLGRDLLTRVIHGTRYTVGLGVGITAARLLFALPLGGPAGVTGSWPGSWAPSVAV